MTRTALADSSRISKLPLLRDYDAESWKRFHDAAETCRATFSARGYSRVDTPIIERTELFLRKSGGELAAQLYSFTDPGGYEVSLRPEFTAPVIRHLVESGRVDQTSVRVEYSGPVFRYPAPEAYDNGLSGSFTQTGAEFIGGSAPEADGEIIAMALEGLSAVGVASPRVVVGHVGLIWDLLTPIKLSDRARLFLVNCVGSLAQGRLETVRERATEIGLMPSPGDEAAPETDHATVDQIGAVLGHSLGGSFKGSAGSRSPEDILARLAEKIRSADDVEIVESALELLSELSQMRGAPREALRQGRAAVESRSYDVRPFDQLEEVIESASSHGVPEGSITVDLGLAREITYYTGSVFDLTDGVGGKLGGGGRYDGLVRALGGDSDVPALGFAFNLDAVLASVGSGG